MTIESDDVPERGHYVYLYRDAQAKPRYVGYGAGTGRPTSHIQGSHNDRLDSFLASGSYDLTIAGPFGTEEVGRAVETALISTLQPDLNRDPGQSRWRFRPLGVPAKYAERLAEDPLTCTMLLDIQGASPRPVLCVIFSDKNFADGRIGYDPAQPPSDRDILARVEKWWQLSGLIQRWQANPSQAPSTLIAIHGRPKAQVIVASLHIDPAAWQKPVRDGAYFQIMTAGPPGLDAFSLRGKRVATKANIRFGSFPAQFFVLVERDGLAYGGHPSGLVLSRMPP